MVLMNVEGVSLIYVGHVTDNGRTPVTARCDEQMT
jgi:hypothetical protein